MREGFDKEIDSLLRRAARAPTAARGNGAGAAKPDTHLDADELAAFAEGALPEAARSNAVSHLADCGECRTLAVNLTRAAGVEAKLDKHALAAAASLPARESVPKLGWLASIFAPRTLRYVVPALAVCLVAVVSFVALRTARRDGGLVSFKGSDTQSASPSLATSQNSSQPSIEGKMNSNVSSNMDAAAPTQGTAGPIIADKSADREQAPESLKKDVDTDAPDGSAPGAPAESKAAGEDAAAQPPARAKEEDAAAGRAPEPIAAAKAAPVAEVPASKSGDNMKAGPPPSSQVNDELAYRDEVQKRSAQQRGVEPQAPDGGARQRSAGNNASNVGGLASTPRDDRSRRENAPAARRGRSDQGAATSDSERANTSEESRSVAGYRFRREGGAWVDVKYKSSMSSTGVRRGTDAYRALVADIPDIGRVAEQLGGEVIVVVRGRAYRIR